MDTVRRGLQIGLAGFGFFAGYWWAVTRWLRHADLPLAELLQTSLHAGLGVSVLYAMLLAGLFWRWIPAAKHRGLKAAVSPVAFTLSFLLGSGGIQGALWLIR